MKSHSYENNGQDVVTPLYGLLVRWEALACCSVPVMCTNTNGQRMQ